METTTRPRRRRNRPFGFLLVLVHRGKANDPIREAWCLPPIKPASNTKEHQAVIDVLYDGLWYGEVNIPSCFPGEIPEEKTDWMPWGEKGMQLCVFSQEEEQKIELRSDTLEHVLHICCNGKLLNKAPDNRITSRKFAIKLLTVP